MYDFFEYDNNIFLLWFSEGKITIYKISNARIIRYRTIADNAAKILYFGKYKENAMILIYVTDADEITVCTICEKASKIKIYVLDTSENNIHSQSLFANKTETAQLKEELSFVKRRYSELINYTDKLQEELRQERINNKI